MAIYKTPYDTTAGSGYRYTNLLHEVGTALAASGGAAVHKYVDKNDVYATGITHQDLMAFNIALIEGGNGFADAVHYFKHPIFISSQNTPVTCVDVRDFGKWDAHQQRFVVRSVTEYIWTIKRAVLTTLWANGKTQQLRDLSVIPAQVYSSLISETIQRQFALDPAEQATVAVIACVFYYGLFEEKSFFDEDDKNLLASKIARLTSVDAKRVFQIIDQIPTVPQTVKQLCETIAQIVQNVALNNLNAGTLFTVVGGTWFGTNSRENICVALEHIPTWLMIVHSSLIAQTYKRATLSKISQRYDKRGAGDEYSKALSAALGGADALETLPTYQSFFGSA